MGIVLEFPLQPIDLDRVRLTGDERGETAEIIILPVFAVEGRPHRRRRDVGPETERFCAQVRQTFSDPPSEDA